MTKRHITPHKGGRTAAVPSGRIRPATLERIHEDMQRQRASWADLVEAKWGDNTNTQGDDRMKQIMKWDADLKKWVPIGASYSGLSEEDAQNALKQLRQWAKDDDSGEKYKARDVVIVPR